MESENQKENLIKSLELRLETIPVSISDYCSEYSVVFLTLMFIENIL